MESQPTNRQANTSHTRLDATGERDVVFCHICENEWYRDSGGLECPSCHSDAVEIISPTNDPRPAPPPIHDDLRDLRNHRPWDYGADHDSDDPPEEDIEGYTYTASGRTANTSSPFSTGPTGRSGPEVLYGESEPITTSANGWTSRTYRSNNGGTTFTFTTGSGGGNFSGPPGFGEGSPFSNDMNTVLTSLFGSMTGASPNGGDHFPPLPGQQGRAMPNIPGMPPGLASIFASMLNPANAVAGDAVYSQEAFDRIISNLMEGTSSNAPGPASANDIANLNKVKVDLKMLGAEGKAECSVCMDDVSEGDEVVLLPCSHWFHEQCATLWLSEHNTCPICRKSISPDSAASTNNTPTATAGTPSRSSPPENNNARARLDRIRSAAGMTTESPLSDSGRRRRSSASSRDSGRGLGGWLRRRTTGERRSQ